MATNWTKLVIDNLNERTSVLPVHPFTGLTALGFTSRGPIWPVMGGDESTDAAAQAAAAKAAADAAAAKAEADAKAAADANGDKGYPDGTPLEQMKPEQREAYWKHQARKHEDRVKAYNGLTPEQIADLKAKADKHDALELELGTTAEKAAAKAADDAKAAVRGELEPEVIRAKLDAAAARAGVSEEDLAKAVEFADTSKFLNANGKVDTDKVKAFVATITPVTGNSTTRRGPTATSHASAGGSGAGALTGREMYEARHKKSSTSAA